MTAGIPESIVRNVFHRFADLEEISAMVEFVAGVDSRLSTGGKCVVDGWGGAGKGTIRLSELRTL